MEQILIVEDDNYINSLLAEALTKEGYRCEQAFSGTEAARLLSEKKYALAVMDLMLPGMSGEALLTKIRETSDMPVIVLTAKDGLDEKIDLLTSGADDYMTKPFELKELIARIGVQLRRRNPDSASQNLSYCGMKLDKSEFAVSVDGQAIPKITKQEFAILELLLRHPKQVFSKDEMFEYAWEEPYMGETKTLDVHISNIRKKIKAVTDREYIETVWGIGYRLAQ